MGGRGAVAAAAVVWCGMLAGGALGTGGVLAALLVATLAAALSARAPDRTGTVAILLALLLAGSARGGGHRLALERSRAAVGDGERLFRITGHVLEPPQRESGEPIVVIAVDAAAPPLVAGARIRLRLPAGVPVEWSDRIEALARIEAPLPLRNPGGYDARAASEATDLVAAGRAFTARVRAARGLAAWPRATVARWRRAVDRRLAVTSDATRELVVPLLVGDRSALSTELSADMRASGLVHLLALSGLHVAWMAGIARGLVAACGGGTAARALAGAACALFYGGIAGPIPSLMRAAVTETIVSSARGRALDPMQSLSLTAIAWLCAAPGWAFDLGFQLSCAATLGLVAIAPVPRSGALVPAVWQPLAATLGAQLAALPLLILRFHAIAWVAPFANLIAVPVCGLLLSAAWLGVALDTLAPGTGAFAFHACEALAWAMRATCQAAAHVPHAMLATGGHPLPVTLAAVGAVSIACAAPPPRDLDGARRPMSRARFLGWLIGSIASGLALLACVVSPAIAPAPEHVWLVALDVGQGDATAIGFRDGWWLIDAGPRSPRHDAGQSVALPFLRWAGVRRLDTVVFTHDDGDHTGGGESVLRGVGAKRVVCPTPLPGVSGPARRFHARTVARGATLRTRPAVRALWPPAPDHEPGVSIDSDNRASLVLEIDAGSRRLVLLADADSAVESALDLAPGIELLKAGHHGSGSSSGAAFLARARPKQAIVSCGRRNPFGHPAPGALARLAAAGAVVHRTDRDGALWFDVGPEGVRRVDWRHGIPIDRGREITCAAPGAAARYP
jgi:competence protein ComEC